VKSLAFLAAAFAATTALAQDSSREFGAVVCISEGGAPWSLKARGTLTRRKSRDEMNYEFRTGQDLFAWRFSTNPQGATTGLSPGYLMERVAPQIFKASSLDERRQRLDATGEIREHVAASALVLRIGAQCPA
jgi:hypothetical protein